MEPDTEPGFDYYARVRAVELAIGSGQTQGDTTTLIEAATSIYNFLINKETTNG